MLRKYRVFFSKQKNKIIRGMLYFFSPSYYRLIATPFNMVNILPRPSTEYVRSWMKDGLTCAEIGVFEGENAANILECLSITKLFLVDIWAPLTESQEELTRAHIHEDNYRKVRKKFIKDTRVEILKMTSLEASQQISDESLDFCYIDADHSYEQCLLDISHWYPKIKPYGLLAGHDIQMPEVRKAIEKFTQKKNQRYWICFPDWLLIKT